MPRSLRRSGSPLSPYSLSLAQSHARRETSFFSRGGREFFKARLTAALSDYRNVDVTTSLGRSDKPGEERDSGREREPVPD